MHGSNQTTESNTTKGRQRQRKRGGESLDIYEMMIEMMTSASASFEKNELNSHLTNSNIAAGAPASQHRPAEDDASDEFASTNIATAVSMSPEQQQANGNAANENNNRRGKYDRDEDRDDGGISGPPFKSNKRQSSSLLSASALKKPNGGSCSSSSKKSFYVVRPGEEDEGDALKEPAIFFSYQDLQLFYKLMGVETNQKATTSTEDSKFDDAEEEPEDEPDTARMHYKVFDNLVDAMGYANRHSNSGEGDAADDGGHEARANVDDESSSSSPHKRQKKTHHSEGGEGEEEESGGNEEENPLAVAARIRTKEAAEQESPTAVPSKLQQLEERQIQNLQDEYDRKFQRKLQELKFFKEEYGHIDIPSISTPLREWLNQQRQLYAELVQQQQLQPEQENGTIAPSASKWNPLKLEHILALTSLGFNIMMTPLPPQPPQAPASLAHLHHHHVPPQYHAAAFASAAAASSLLAAGGHPPPTVGYPHVHTSSIHEMMTPNVSAAAAAAAGRLIRETSQPSLPSSTDTSPTAAAAAAAAAGGTSVARQHVPAGNHNSQWSEQEDAIICEAVMNSQEQPFTRWSDLARTQLPNRKGKQIRDRWVNQLNPAITKTPFTSEDDMTLWNAHQECGKRWVEISSKFFGGRRSENQVKNRWYSAAFQKFISANNIMSKSSSVKTESVDSSSSSSNTKEV